MLFPPEVLKHCRVLAGPTASGKTACALRLARQMNAEIISLDSMAVYRTMDIGTAKPEPSEQAVCPHHLIDIVDPDKDFSVAEFLPAARQAVDGILERRRVPLFVGGTGLYLRAILRGVFEGPPANDDLRRELQSAANQHSPDWLLQQLAEVDSVTAKRLHPNDQRRIIRAIEVYRLTGRPFSEHQQHPPRPPHERPALAVWLEPPRAWLHDRINRRVDKMMQLGLLDETRTLLARTPPPGKTARQALGYRELIAHLEDGLPLDDCVEQIRRGTRQFAKRQHTWFRNLEECTSVRLTGNESPDEVAERVLQIISTE